MEQVNIRRRVIFLEQSIIDSEDELKKLENISDQNNLDFQGILNANPDIANPNILSKWKDQYIRHLKEREFRTPFDFLSILVSGPSPADLEILGPGEVTPRFFRQTLHPFLNHKIPTSLTDFDFAHLAKPPEGLTHDEIGEIVKTNFYKESTQRFLPKLFNRFIFDYIELAGKVGFSYGAVWQLKEKYLKLVYDSIISGRKPILNKILETERKNVQAAEKHFPNIKIISDDSKINSIKIRLPKLSKIKNVVIDILLMGESGTGKELFARAIHESSGRAGNFVPVNCASIPVCGK